MKRAAKKATRSKRAPAKRAVKKVEAKAVRRKRTPRKTASPRKPARPKAATKKAASRKAPAKRASNKASAVRERRRTTRERPGEGARRGLGPYSSPQPEFGGLGADSGGQSGDTEGLKGFATADSQSVRELLEEGQSFEAGVISGVEDAPDADAGEVTTREVPEDDVPPEYLDQ